MDKQSSNNGQIFKGELYEDQLVEGSEAPKQVPVPQGPSVPIGSTNDVNAHEHRRTNTPIFKEEHLT